MRLTIRRDKIFETKIYGNLTHFKITDQLHCVWLINNYKIILNDNIMFSNFFSEKSHKVIFFINNVLIN